MSDKTTHHSPLSNHQEVSDIAIRVSKLVRVVQGTVFDVAVDIRKSSLTFGQHVGVELSADNKRMLWAPEFERSIAWNDPAINIQWPLHGEPTLSAKDQQAKPLAKVECFT